MKSAREWIAVGIAVLSAVAGGLWIHKAGQSGAANALTGVALVWWLLDQWLRGPAARRFLRSTLRKIHQAAKRGELQAELRSRSVVDRTLDHGATAMIIASIVMWFRA